MTTNEMKSYLANYKRLKIRAESLTRDMEKFPSDRPFLEPLLNNVTLTAEDIAEKISMVEKGERKELLIRKYINGETLEEIGDSMGYSSRHIGRLLTLAVSSMKDVKS